MCCSKCATAETKRKLAYAFHVGMLVLTNITCVALACFFAMVFFYETTDHLPHLTRYTLHHWINILITVVALVSQCTSLLLLHTVTLDKFNFGRYRKLNPCMVGFGVIFTVFGIMEMARYIGMNVTTGDLFTEIRNQESNSQFLTKDRFRIPAWFDYFQEKKQCCGVINLQDYGWDGKLNGTQVDANGIPRGRHGVPQTCCRLRQLPCGEARVFEMKAWEQMKAGFPLEGCGRLIGKMISDTVFIGMSLCLTYSALCFISWIGLRSVSQAVIRELGRIDTRTIKRRYNYADGYFSHLENIYMDVATGESEAEAEACSHYFEELHKISGAFDPSTVPTSNL